MEEDKNKSNTEGVEDELDEDLFDSDDDLEDDDLFDEDEDEDEDDVNTKKQNPQKPSKDNKDFIIERQRKKIEKLQKISGGNGSAGKQDDLSLRLKALEDKQSNETRNIQLTSALNGIDNATEVEKRVRRMMVHEKYSNVPINILVSAVAHKLNTAKAKANDSANKDKPLNGSSIPADRVYGKGNLPDFSKMTRAEVSKYTKENRL